jgi:hypothetical protein
MTTRRAAVLWVWLGVAAGALAQEAGGEKIVFKRLYSPGKYLMTQTMTMNQTVATGQMQQEQQIAQTVVVGMDVAQPDKDGNVKMVITFRQIKSKTTAGAQTITFDSDLPADKQTSPLAKVFGPMLKLKIEVELGPDGKVRKLTGFEKMWDEIAKSDPAMAPMMGELKKQFGDQMARDLVTKSFEMLPTKAVGAGDSWKTDMPLNVPFLGEIKAGYDCKVAAIEKTRDGKVVVVDMTGSLVKDTPTPTTMGQAVLTTKKVVMKQSGQMRINVDTGVPVAQTLRQQGEMLMSMQGPDGTAMDMEIKQDMQMQATVKPDPGEAPGSPATQPAPPKE